MKKGFVCFCDILGYQNIIRNNQINYIAELIDDTIHDLPNKVQTTLTNFISTAKKREKFVEKIKSINVVIVSDSIILFLENDDKAVVPNIFTFLSYMASLFRITFDNGIPLRGAIDFGEYYLNKQTFAGKPIINSYSLSERLDFSGCAFTDEFSEFFSSELDKLKGTDIYSGFNRLFREYLAPLKDGEKKLCLLNWYLPFSGWGTKHDDITQYVLEKFHSHKKDVSINVVNKMMNTERIIRYSLIDR